MSKPKVLDNPIQRQFQDLASVWKGDAGVSSSLTDRFSHPSYRQIIAMGNPAVPFLLSELEREPDWWFAALKAITGADPVSPASRGRLNEMTEAWLKWGREHGYHS